MESKISDTSPMVTLDSAEAFNYKSYITMTHNIQVSEKIIKEFEKLKEELAKIYPGQKLDNDQILEAMIAGFFDSLEYMKKEAKHHHHGDHECCGSGKCEDDGECKCC